MNDELGNLSDREILILVHSDVRTLKERLNNHADRIRLLERVATIAGTLGTVASAIAGWMKIHVSLQS